MVLVMDAVNSPPPNWLTSLRRVGGAVTDALFPPQCLSCQGPAGSAGALCAACWDATSFIDAQACRRCGLPMETDFVAELVCAGCMARPPAFARAVAVYRYDTARDLVLRFKHADRTDYAPAFATWMRRAGAELIAASDIVVPVPLHRWRLLKRRYNQAAVLANAIAVQSGLEALPDALTRIRRTPSQGAMISARARRRNVLGAFKVRDTVKPRLKGKRILLIDDVMTTGATLEACARTLKRAGAAEISALTLARVVRAAEAEI